MNDKTTAVWHTICLWVASHFLAAPAPEGIARLQRQLEQISQHSNSPDEAAGIVGWQASVELP